MIAGRIELVSLRAQLDLARSWRDQCDRCQQLHCHRLPLYFGTIMVRCTQRVRLQPETLLLLFPRRDWSSIVSCIKLYNPPSLITDRNFAHAPPIVDDIKTNLSTASSTLWATDLLAAPLSAHTLSVGMIGRDIHS